MPTSSPRLPEAATLSARAQALIGEPPRADFAVYAEAQTRLYDPHTRPEGVVSLFVAENVLSWPTMRARLTQAAAEPIPEWVAQYTEFAGAPGLREAVAGFAGRHVAPLGGMPSLALDPACVCLTSGATGVVELAAHVAGDPGDVVAFPAPNYPAYRPDISNKAALERVDIQPAAGWRDRRGDHPLTTDDLDRCLAETRARGKRLRLVVLTQPDNPTGTIYDAPQLEAIADWATEHEVHVAVNEIYALSQVDVRDPRLASDYATAPRPYRSFLHTLEARQSPWLHWWYSVSKDFGLSGLRCGALYTRNAAFRQAFSTWGMPHMISNHTQWLLAQVLSDEAFVRAFAKTNQAHLTESYARVVTALRARGVEYVAARGSLFVWSRLNAGGNLGDEAYWERACRERGVLLSHPGGFGQAESGWMRLVYSSVSPEALDEALRRLCA